MLDFIIYKFLCFRWRVSLLGSNANNSAKAGVFYWNLNNDSANINQNIGGQLSLFQKIFRHKNFASWQNTKHCLTRVGRLILEDSEVK